MTTAGTECQHVQCIHYVNIFDEGANDVDSRALPGNTRLPLSPFSDPHLSIAIYTIGYAA